MRIVAIHLSDAEHEQLQALAPAAGRTMPNVIHESIRENPELIAELAEV